MKALLAAIVLTWSALAATAWLLQAGTARDVLVPGPARVVQNFVGALAANRPGIAHNLVDERARTRLTTERLEAFASQVRSRHGDFRFAAASEERRHGDEASVRATLRTAHSGRVEVTYHLVRDPATQIWKISGM